MFRKTSYLLKVLLIFSIFFTGCSFFNQDLNGYLRKYTEEAAIGRYVLDDTYPVDDNGFTCIDSFTDHTITFYFRNPMDYDIAIKYQIEGEEFPEVFTQVQSADKKSMDFTIPQAILQFYDEGTKNISGTVYVSEANFPYREFPSFDIALHADSKPPLVEKLCVQLSDSSNGNYVLCFYLPKVTGTVHENDTKVLYINDTKLYFDDNKITTDAEGNSLVTESKPANLAPLNGYTFQTDSGLDSEYRLVYYDTGVRQTTSTEYFTVKIVDDAGLSSSSIISTASKQLKQPEIENLASLLAGQAVSEETGTYPVKITHPGKYIDDSVCADYTINYTITKDGNPFKTGSGKGDVTVDLPVGNYSISAKASRPSDITSEEMTEDNIIIKPIPVYYVDQNGSDSNNGSKQKPFRTIQKAIETFNSNVGSGKPFAASTDCQIYVMSDITPDTALQSAPGPMVNVDSNFSGTKIKIEGYGGQRKLDAQRNSLHDGRVISVDNSTVDLNLSNLIITGGYLEDVDVKGAGIFGSKDLILNNVTVTGNKLTDSNLGAGVYASGQITLSGKVNITGNIGKDNVPNNMYLQKVGEAQKPVKINNLSSESRIGVTTENEPLVGTDVVFTTDNNIATPKDVFISDKGYSILPSDREAKLCLQIAATTSGISENVIFELNRSTVALNNPITVTTKLDAETVTPASIKLELYHIGNPTGLTVNTNRITILDPYWPKGNYELYITAVVNGLTYSAKVIITYD